VGSKYPPRHLSRVKRDNCRSEDLARCSSEDYSALKVYARRKDIKHRQFSCAENVDTSVFCILCYEKKISFALGKTTKQRDRTTEQKGRLISLFGIVLHFCHFLKFLSLFSYFFCSSNLISILPLIVSLLPLHHFLLAHYFLQYFSNHPLRWTR